MIGIEVDLLPDASTSLVQTRIAAGTVDLALLTLPRPALVVAADGGARHAAGLGVAVDAWVGDFDSSDGVQVDAPREVHPAAKNETDAELAVLDRWVRNHTIGRFGPVREVERGLVLEIAFDAAQRSGRHKSGVALRFPRVARLRLDKRPEDADRLETLLRLIEPGAEAA